MKRAVVKVIFGKLELNAVPDGDQATVEGHALNEGVAGLVEANGRRASGRNDEGSSLVEEAAFGGATDAELLAVVLADKSSSKAVLVELLRRYSNRPDLLGPLVDVLRRIHDPAADEHETVTTISGRTASADYVRRALTEDDITDVAEAYRSGTTAQALAERYDVHINTIKRKLRKRGVRRATETRRRTSLSFQPDRHRANSSNGKEAIECKREGSEE